MTTELTPEALTPAPFSTIILDRSIDDLPKPDAAPYFVLTKRGPMVYKKMHYGYAMVPVRDVPIPDLPDNSKGYLWLDPPPFPRLLLNQAWSFFLWAWEERKSEAMVDITWDEEHGYRLFVPPQTASAGGVKCIRNEEHYKSALVGTIHSHCNGGAYHSGTDTHDAESHDGLHMTMGRVSANKPELDIMVSANKVQWNKIKPEEALEEGDWKLIQHPVWWERLHEHPAAVEKFKNTTFAAGGRPGGVNVTRPQSRGIPTHGNGSTGFKPNNDSPYSNHTLSNVHEIAEKVFKHKALPESVDPAKWLSEFELTLSILEDTLGDLDSLGVRFHGNFWYSKQAVAAHDRTIVKEDFPVTSVKGDIIGLWDEEELDENTRSMLIQMISDDPSISMHETPSGLMIVEASPGAQVVADPPKGKNRKERKN